jgi:hypothetical protein
LRLGQYGCPSWNTIAHSQAADIMRFRGLMGYIVIVFS